MMGGAALTSEQDRVLSFIRKTRDETGVPPTVREIADALGYKSPNNVRQHLRLIEQKGFVRLLQGKARGIEIVQQAADDFEPDLDAMGVPLIGAVAAGAPITAIENVEGYITLDKSIFRGDDLFALRVRGDSMIGVGILNGDIVVVKKKDTAEHNEIVVVVIDGDATLKRFIKRDGGLFLHAENPAYEDIELQSVSSIQIAGKLVGLIRKC
ncbi:MAG: transcriptional repressor LexA [Fibrobacter sp.]|nr:transcriptional repressor LexA [Fibrobacter sp.]